MWKCRGEKAMDYMAIMVKRDRQQHENRKKVQGTTQILKGEKKGTFAFQDIKQEWEFFMLPKLQLLLLASRGHVNVLKCYINCFRFNNNNIQVSTFMKLVACPKAALVILRPCLAGACGVLEHRERPHHIL